jgi:FtsZ-interacting cell division protein ZipA
VYLMSSTTTVIVVVLVVLALIAIGILVSAMVRQSRGRRLRSRFGPEYDRTVDQTGDRAEAEKQLEQRVHERDELPVRELEPGERERFAGTWRNVQSRFVDDPVGAVREADQLCASVMNARGYPTDDFERQAALVSVDHADVVPSYRQAHELTMTAERSPAATDDLREAMVRYRALFERLLGEPAGRDGNAGTGDGWRPRDPDQEAR